MGLRELILLLLVVTVSYTSPQKSQFDTVTVAFWNLENLFDTNDDPRTKDEDFLPGSEKKWDNDKLKKKLLNQSAVIRAMNNNRGPELLGICEVENAQMVHRLVNDNMIDLRFKYIHTDSPDERGIDVGLLYKPGTFNVLEQSVVSVALPDGYKTRDILLVLLQMRNSYKDTLAVFINHWPSRRGGEAESEINRVTAAKALRAKVNEIKERRGLQNVIIMGDFNDEPHNKSIIEELNAIQFTCDSNKNLSKYQSEGKLINVSQEAVKLGEGSYKYRDQWNMLDQIILSPSLVLSDRFNYVCKSFEVFKPYFMVQKTGKYAGTALPTYGGNTYLAGYSDHFPVLARIAVKK